MKLNVFYPTDKSKRNTHETEARIGPDGQEISTKTDPEVDEILKAMLRNEYDFYGYIVQRLNRQLAERVEAKKEMENFNRIKKL